MHIFIALISNGDKTRDKSLLESLKVFQAMLPNTVSVELHRFAEQDEIRPLLLSERFLKIAGDFSYLARWVLIEFPNRKRIRSMAILAHMVFLRVKQMLSEHRTADTTSAKQIEISKKHLRAWKGFLDTQDDYFLALEDDANFLITSPTKDSKDAIKELLIELGTSSEGFIASLAKGFSEQELGVTLTPLPQNNYLSECSAPIVNTTAAYLVNRKLLQRFSDWIVPNDRFISIDLLFNKLAYQTRARKSETPLHIRCIHSTPPLFDNGSLTGRYSPMDGIHFLHRSI